MEDLPAPMRLAMRESKKSVHRFKMGAAIARGKRILSSACNSSKTHPKFGSGAYNTLHCEGNAIYRAVRKGIDLTGATIYVYRENDNLAKPCPCCMGLIHHYGIVNVVYSG